MHCISRKLIKLNNIVKIFAETNRLLLREIVLTDAEAIFELDNDPEVHAFLGNNPIKTMDQAENIVNFIRLQYKENGIGRWAAVEKTSGRFIGWSGLKLIREQVNGHSGYYDLGYRLIRKYWSQGYAGEAATASLKYGFETLKLPVIYAIADIENAGSVRVLQKAGFRSANTFDYEGVPHYWFSLQKEEWNKIR